MSVPINHHILSLKKITFVKRSFIYNSLCPYFLSSLHSLKKSLCVQPHLQLNHVRIKFMRTMMKLPQQHNLSGVQHVDTHSINEQTHVFLIISYL